MNRHFTLAFCNMLALVGLLAFGRVVQADNTTHRVENQLVVLGRSAELQQAIAPVSDQAEVVNGVELPWFQLLPPASHPLAGQPDAQMVLLNIFDPTLTVEQALQQIAASGAFVFASPNWVTAAANVWYIEGAPSVPAVEIVSAEPLSSQIAFTQVGYTTSIAHTGDRVRIGVFDTSPFAGEGSFATTIDGLPLTAHHGYALPDPSPVPTTTVIDEHGTAVMSLSGAVAPTADYHLYRVLNNGGVGDVFTLNAALSSFIDASLLALGGSIDGAVINLSLVVHADPGDPVPPLDAVLSGADAAGIAIIGAAGNESDEGGALSPKVPASYPYVLAVSGVNSADDRACFSHSGDIAGFSGETLTDGACAPPTMTQRIRTAATADGVQLKWAGTSFATPLVAAGAALLLDKFDGQPVGGHVNDLLQQSARMANGNAILDLEAAVSSVPLVVSLMGIRLHVAPLNMTIIAFFSLAAMTIICVWKGKPSGSG